MVSQSQSLVCSVVSWPHIFNMPKRLLANAHSLRLVAASSPLFQIQKYARLVDYFLDLKIPALKMIFVFCSWLLSVLKSCSLTESRKFPKVCVFLQRTNYGVSPNFLKLHDSSLYFHGWKATSGIYAGHLCIVYACRPRLTRQKPKSAHLASAVFPRSEHDERPRVQPIQRTAQHAALGPVAPGWFPEVGSGMEMVGTTTLRAAHWTPWHTKIQPIWFVCWILVWKGVEWCCSSAFQAYWVNGHFIHVCFVPAYVLHSDCWSDASCLTGKITATTKEGCWRGQVEGRQSCRESLLDRLGAEIPSRKGQGSRWQ